MRKKILLAEYFRLQELLEAHNFMCPVCRVSNDMAPRFSSKNCDSYHPKSACHPDIQLRCKQIMELATTLENGLGRAMLEVENNLYDKFGLTERNLKIKYREFRKKRLGEPF